MSTFQAITTAYPRLADKLEHFWQGSVLDGQYQAKGFAEKLKDLLKKPTSEFFSVVWDPPHWVNLAIEDVIDRKIGISKDFLKRLIGRYKIAYRDKENLTLLNSNHTLF